MLYIYPCRNPFAIVQAPTLIKLFYNFSQSACYTEKLHQCSLSSHCLFLFPGCLRWCCTVQTLQNPFSDFFFQQCRISYCAVSYCSTNYLSTPGPVALSKMCHMMLLRDLQCFFLSLPIYKEAVNCSGRFWIPCQQTSQPEYFDYLHLNPSQIKPLQIQPTFLLLLLISGERP